MAAASATTLSLVASLSLLALLAPAASASVISFGGSSGPTICPYEGNDIGVIYAGFGGAGFQVVFNGNCVIVQQEDQGCASCDGVEQSP